ncbi:MAG: hypothetical protein L6Q99_12315 [Planctomycetes bacterium]|nr:hypothetical protein [Planctomycetota bacterium]
MLARPAVAVPLIALSLACAAERSESSGIRASSKPPTMPAAASEVVRASPVVELGEVVHRLSDAHWCVFQDSKLDHWFGSEGQGAYRVSGERIVRYTTRDGLAHDTVREIQEDASGNLFFSTHGGISKFDGRRFETLVPVDGGTRAWRLDSRDVWVRGVGKHDVGRYDGETLYALEFPRIELEDWYDATFPTAVARPYSVYTIRRDSRGALWFGTACFGACRYDGKSFDWALEDELTELDTGPAFGLRGIIEDREGKFWLSNLMHRYDAYPRDDGSQSTPGAPLYRREPGLVSTDPNDDVGNAYFMSGLTDRNGISWAATYGAGVWRIAGESLTQLPVLVDGMQIHLLSIYEDKQGVLWLGTQAHGAWRFDGKTFVRFRP